MENSAEEKTKVSGFIECENCLQKQKIEFAIGEAVPYCRVCEDPLLKVNTEGEVFI